jgi:hypothetical protein
MRIHDKILQKRIEVIEEREAEQFREYGWFAHYAQVDKKYLDAHTHGLMKSFGHYDLQCVLPIDPKRTQTLFASLVEEISKGATFKEDVIYRGIINCPIKFKLFKQEDRYVLRLIVPDKTFKFPEDEGCAELFKYQYDIIE